MIAHVDFYQIQKLNHLVINIHIENVSFQKKLILLKSVE